MSDGTSGKGPAGGVTSGPADAPAFHRNTRQKAAIAEILRRNREFRSAQELHAQLSGAGYRMGLTTVYSRLRELTASGWVDSIHGSEGELLYRRCSAPSHHHHLVCRMCGIAVEVDGPAVEEWADALARRVGFTDVSHTVEISGICPRCAR